MNPMFREKQKPLHFGAIRVQLASPETIKSWSHGEVRKPETINYRTFKPERDGLFCARIFGPTKDYECLCGKYKRMKHAGIVCEKCGVEVIKSSVRRERMGHIELAAPVAHIWFMRSLPSRIGTLLDVALKDLERVLYFESWIVLDPKVTDLNPGQLLEEEEYWDALEKWGDDGFTASIGAEAVYQMLLSLQLDELSVSLRSEMVTLGSKAKRKKVAKRMRIVEAFRESGNQPEWMVHTVVPVIPPELRPLVPLDGGRFATSDVNDLYRRVINRNNRLKRLLELNAPDIIIRNEKRMLQEAVDALYDNGRHGRSVTGPNRRPLKSLSDLLKGKQGRFRQNLLGKRVDYSGRSVIVIGPDLKLHQCGLPKIMALELFKPFIYNKLMQRDIASSIKSAKKLVEKQTSEVWDVLDEVIREHPVILNRAPTLHRLGMQAFEPVLIEGKAIRLHPLVCTAFNADFDGDQMAVHVPLSLEAQIEARVLMMSTNNILSPANGKPIIVPTQDIVLGCYYMTRERPGSLNEGTIFGSTEEVRFAYDLNQIGLQAKIQCRIDGVRHTTTTGRVLMYDVVPKQIPFELVNKVMDKKALGAVIDHAFRHVGAKETVILADKLRTIGYENSTVGGISICVSDMRIPAKKDEFLDASRTEVEAIEQQYRDGVITSGEKYNKVIDEWQRANNKIKDEMMEEIGYESITDDEGKVHRMPSFNNIYIMADSGARGSQEQMRQLSGMRGLMAKPSGEIIETPITSNFREGLNVLQYFISTHGARKGLADTALKTANSGYLTRKLVDVAQDSIISEDDCGTIDGIEMTALVQSGEIVEPLGERILGRTALYDVIDPYNDRVLTEAGQEISEEVVAEIENAGIMSVWVRSVLTCKTKYGVCIRCYGRDLARGTLVNIGEAVGVIAAQSIGEPGTQLTMRTFHIGGAATKRVEQSGIEVRLGGKLSHKNISVVAGPDKKLVVMSRNAEVALVDGEGREREVYHIPYGAILNYQDGEDVPKGEKLAEWDPFTRPIITDVAGTAKFGDIITGATVEERRDEITHFTEKVIREDNSGQGNKPRISIKDAKGNTIDLAEDVSARYFLPVGAILTVNDGDKLVAGQVIAKTPRETLKTKDITGGLPRVSELFDARKPKDQAVITEIDGVIRYAGEAKGKRQITVIPEYGEPLTYAIPKGRHVIVHERDWVKAGDPLTEGSIDPHDILSVLGERDLASFLVDEIQEVYRLQGVKINDKHIETVVRQMLRRVRILESGDTSMLPDEAIEKSRFEELNEAAVEAGKQPATGEPMLLGITKASLSTESWISAASFQETTKVLTEASIFGRTDKLRGLKENVIVGRLIPAGSGNVKYRKKRISIEEHAEKLSVDLNDEEEVMAEI